MKAINPKVMALRERLKDNPQQMQQEMMRIYKEEKVNPIGGCLPIFLQMPFFIALYWVLLWPFYGALIAALLLVTYVPAFSLALPRLFMGYAG